MHRILRRATAAAATFGLAAALLPAAPASSLGGGSVEGAFTADDTFVEDARLTVTAADAMAFRNGAGGPGHSESDTVDLGAEGVDANDPDRYRMFFRTFTNGDSQGTKTSDGTPAGIGLATSKDGHSWVVHEGGRALPGLSARKTRVYDAYNCSGDCVETMFAPSVIVDTDKSLLMTYEVMDTGQIDGSKPRHWVEAARSTDRGLSWHPLIGEDGKPAKLLVAEADWEGYDTAAKVNRGNVGTPELYFDGTRYVVSYHGYSDVSKKLNRGRAAGLSLLDLDKHDGPDADELPDPVFLHGTITGEWDEVGPGKASDIRIGTTVYRIYEGFWGSAICNQSNATVGWGLAKSTDNGFTWTKSSANPVRLDRQNVSCGEDMPAWQTINGEHMVVTTNYDHPLDREATLKRYLVDVRAVQWTSSRTTALGQSDRDGEYWVLDEAGAVHGFGNAATIARPADVPTAKWVGLAMRPQGDGYWMVSAAGHVRAAGKATGSRTLSLSGATAVAVERTRTGGGHWVLTNTGKVFAYGDAKVWGSLSGITDAIAIVATSDDKGYWIARRNGTVKSFGSARSYGSVPDYEAAAAGGAVGLAVRKDNMGYWLLGGDGRVWTLPVNGNTANYGSTGAYQPRPGMNATSMGRRATGTGTGTVLAGGRNDQGSGYYQLQADGAVIDFGNALYLGHVHSRTAPTT